MPFAFEDRVKLILFLLGNSGHLHFIYILVLFVFVVSFVLTPILEEIIIIITVKFCYRAGGRKCA